MPEYGLDKLEEMILLALIRLGPNAYGVTIRREIVERTGRDVPFATTYKVLERLERKGFVSSYQGDPTPERGGRAKKHFRIETSGELALNEDRKAMNRIWAGIDIPSAV